MPELHRVALLINHSTSHDRGILRGVAHYIRSEHRWSCTYDPWRAAHDLPSLDHYDGIIAQLGAESVYELALRSSVPVVAVSYGANASPPVPMVLTDDAAVGALVARHFLERGFRHFAYLGRSGHRYSRDYYTGLMGELGGRGYSCAMFESELGFNRFTAACSPPGELCQWLERLPKPVGILACNDDVGCVIIHTCLKVGILVPDDVAVIGIDNDDLLCELISPPLSSVALSSERIGFTAAALLHRLMSGDAAPAEPLLIPPVHIVTRQSSDILAVADVDVRYAVRYIRLNASKGISTQDVVEEVAVPRRTLQRRFQRALGCTITTQILRARLEQAKQLLACTELAISDVASRTGFSSHVEFSNTFRREVQTTPSCYRRQFQPV